MELLTNMPPIIFLLLSAIALSIVAVYTIDNAKKQMLPSIEKVHKHPMEDYNDRYITICMEIERASNYKHFNYIIKKVEAFKKEFLNNNNYNQGSTRIDVNYLEKKLYAKVLS